MVFRILLFLGIILSCLPVEAQVKLVEQKIIKGPEVEYIQGGSFKYVDLSSVSYDGKFHDKYFKLNISNKSSSSPVILKLGKLRWSLPKGIYGMGSMPDLNTLALTKTISEDPKLDRLLFEYRYGQEMTGCRPLIFGSSRGQANIIISLSKTIIIETYEYNEQCHIVESIYNGVMH